MGVTHIILMVQLEFEASFMVKTENLNFVILFGL